MPAAVVKAAKRGRRDWLDGWGSRVRGDELDIKQVGSVLVSGSRKR